MVHRGRGPGQAQRAHVHALKALTVPTGSPARMPARMGEAQAALGSLGVLYMRLLTTAYGHCKLTYHTDGL